jgi:YgiT-type zinc finger domain-containing protein
MPKQEKCEFCDGNVEQRKVRAAFHHKRDTIYVNIVPAWVCTRCAEQYCDALVYQRLEETARSRNSIKKKISFPLAEFKAA